MRPISALTALSLLLALLTGCSGSNVTRDMNAVQRFHLETMELAGQALKLST